MVALLPYGNSSSELCQGVDEYNSKRPDFNPELNAALIALTAFFCAVEIGSTYFAYIYRKEPMFYRVRPFALTATMNIACALATCGYFIPNILPTFPCELELVIHAACATLVTCVFAIRALVFIVETQYNALLRTESRVVDGRAATTTQDDTASVTTSNHMLGEEMRGLCNASTLFFQLGFATKPLDKFSVADLALIKRYYMGIFMVLILPPWPILLIASFAVPAYHNGCTQCPFTLETFFVVMAGLLLWDGAIVYLVYTGWTKVKPDPQRIMNEMLVTLAMSATWVIIGYALEMADPGDVHYLRIFSWRVLTALGPFMYVCCSVLYPAYLAHKYQKFRNLQAATKRIGDSSLTATRSHNTMNNFTDILAQDADLKRDFYMFAQSRYCMESINFVEDVKAYQLECDTMAPSDKWKRNKALKLIKTYVQVGAPQEVNIGSEQRKEIIETNLATCSSQRLSLLFSSAYEEVVAMLASGPWIDFQNEKKRKARKKRFTKFGSAAVMDLEPSRETA